MAGRIRVVLATTIMLATFKTISAEAIMAAVATMPEAAVTSSNNSSITWALLEASLVVVAVQPCRELVLTRPSWDLKVALLDSTRWAVEDVVVESVLKVVEVRWVVSIRLKRVTSKACADRVVEVAVEVTKAATTLKVATKLREITRASRTTRLSCASTSRLVRLVHTLTTAPTPTGCTSCASR